MMEERDVLVTFSTIRRETLYVWIDRGWLSPERGETGFRFRDIDIARLRLIHDFHAGMELGEDALDVILPLIDQVHGLRNQLGRLAAAVEAQPAAVRKGIAAALRRD